MRPAGLRKRLISVESILLIGLLSAVCCAAMRTEAPVFSIAQTAVPRVIEPIDGFAYSPSPVTGSAVWAAELLTPETLAGTASRPSFFEDPDLPEHLRASARDYARSGTDAGHLGADANAGSYEAKRARARFSNTVPQNSRMNRGLWAELERHVRDLVHDDTEVYVVTAPAYRGFPTTLVGSLIKPTHLVKAVLVVQSGRPALMECWVIPNVDPKPGATLSSYRYTVDFAEELLQLDLFPWLDDETESRMESTL